MIKFSLKITLPDLDRHEIEVRCPRCRLHNWTRLGEIRRRGHVICRGCYANIIFEDHLGGVHRFIRGLENTFRKWR